VAAALDLLTQLVRHDLGAGAQEMPDLAEVAVIADDHRGPVQRLASQRRKQCIVAGPEAHEREPPADRSPSNGDGRHVRTSLLDDEFRRLGGQERGGFGDTWGPDRVAHDL
jgi:hypothetical protein